MEAHETSGGAAGGLRSHRRPHRGPSQKTYFRLLNSVSGPRAGLRGPDLGRKASASGHGAELGKRGAIASKGNRELVRKGSCGSILMTRDGK